jgi:uncharacterized protein
MSVQAASIFIGRPTSVPSIPLQRNPARSLGLLGIFGWGVLVPVVVFVLQLCVLQFGLALWNPKAPSAEAFGVAEAIYFAFAAVLFAWACRHPDRNVARRFGLVRPRGRYLLLGLIALVLPWALIFGLALAGFTAANSSHNPPTLFALAFLGFSNVVIAPVSEELVYRGLVYDRLAGSRLGGHIVTALVWALLHMGKTWSGAATVFVSGLALGLLRWHTGSTWVTIAVHAAHNAIVTAFIVAHFAVS